MRLLNLVRPLQIYYDILAIAELRRFPTRPPCAPFVRARRGGAPTPGVFWLASGSATHARCEACSHGAPPNSWFEAAAAIGPAPPTKTAVWGRFSCFGIAATSGDRRAFVGEHAGTGPLRVSTAPNRSLVFSSSVEKVSRGRCAHARPWGRLRAWVSAVALRGEFSAASRAVDSPGGGAPCRDFVPSHCARGSR